MIQTLKDVYKFHKSLVGSPTPVKSVYKKYISYTVDGVYHSEDGPAYIHFMNGVDDKSDWQMTWFYNGSYHRLDGPAFMTSDGHREYWIYDRNLTEQEFTTWYEIVYLKEYVEPPCNENWFL